MDTCINISSSIHHSSPIHLYDYNHVGGGGSNHMIDNTCLRAHALPHRPPCLGPYESRGRDMVPCESSGSDSDNSLTMRRSTRSLFVLPPFRMQLSY